MLKSKQRKRYAFAARSSHPHISMKAYLIRNHSYQEYREGGPGWGGASMASYIIYKKSQLYIHKNSKTITE